MGHGQAETIDADNMNILSILEILVFAVPLGVVMMELVRGDK